MILPGFAPKSPSLPPPPPPPPVREDPSVAARQRELKVANRLRKGRGASILTSNDDDALGGANVNRPSAKTGARMLG